eukprot:5183026-Prymnesium_polylepis.1
MHMRAREACSEPSGEPAATSSRALGCSRLVHAGAQRHARPASAALQPVEPLSADLYHNAFPGKLPRGPTDEQRSVGGLETIRDRACRRQLGGLAAASLAERVHEERWKQQRHFPAQNSLQTEKLSEYAGHCYSGAYSCSDAENTRWTE